MKEVLGDCTWRRAVELGDGTWRREGLSWGLVPGGEGSQRGPEARHAPGPSLPEGLLYQLALGRWVDPPETPFPRLLLGTRHLDEVAVQGQVVPDRVLERPQSEDE